jgi:poly(beta-D-mannuronate) lyase
MVIKKIKYLLLGILVISTELFAQYYVSSASELNGILSTLVPGDTVIMKNGTWTNQHLIFDAFGNENDSIVLKAETPGHVILTGTSTLRIRGKFLKVDGLRFESGYSPDNGVIEFRRGSSKAYNSRLTNTSVVNYNPASKSNEYKWVSIYGTNNRVDHCYFENKLNDGALLVVWIPDSGEEVFHRIDNNYFGERKPLGYNGGETIRIGTSAYSLGDASCIIESNYFERCDGEAEIISNKTGNNTFRYNTFFECDGTLTFRHGEKSYAYGNYFFGNNKPGTGGIRLVGPSHEIYNNYFVDLAGGDSDWNGALTMMNGIGPEPINGYTQVDSVLIANNTFVNCKNTFLIGEVNSSYSSTMVLPPANSVFANNIVTTSEQIFQFANMFENMTFEGNLMNGSSLGFDMPEGITLIDPQLVFGDDSLWRITETSPAYNAAVGDYPMVEYDMDGQLRDAYKDIGADEYSLEAILNFPRNSENTGPNWLGGAVPVGISIEINGGGKVEFDPEGGVYELGSEVQLTAVPNEGSTFDSWSGDINSSDNPLTIIVDGSIQITANFNDPNFYKYTLWKTGSGEVQVDPDLDEFPEGTSAVFTAVPAEGWQFKYWNGSLSGTENPDTLVFDSNETIQVVFELITNVQDIETPTEFKLNQNYPNPFNPSTLISYTLKESVQTNITIVNVLGSVVDEIVDDYKLKGSYQLSYNASHLTSGVYFVKIKAGSFSDTKKMILSK